MQKYLVSVKVYDLDKIACIKHLRTTLCLGLKEAKDMYEAFERGGVLFTADELVNFQRFVILSDHNTVGAQYDHDQNRKQNSNALFQISEIDLADTVASYKELMGAAGVTFAF